MDGVQDPVERLTGTEEQASRSTGRRVLCGLVGARQEVDARARTEGHVA